MSHHDRAFDSALAYHQHVAAGITTAHGHLTAAALAAEVAHAEYTRAALASTAAERRMFLRAGDKARATRDGHELAAEITAIGEQVIGR
ncbi:hypothetical protein [Amycolatopsis thermoflava]|uniref:hypothetical protein n=1 Tax=Amycolatopsis thermoflava TaxID=84480 RepID=UPI003D723BEE